MMRASGRMEPRTGNAVFRTGCAGIALGLTLAMCAAEPPENGGFEASADGPHGWRVFNLAGEDFTARISDQARSGRHALHIARTAAGEDAGVDLWDEPLPVRPASPVVVRFAARKTAGDARSCLDVSIHEFSVTGALLREGNHRFVAQPLENEYGDFEWSLELASPLTAAISLGFRLGNMDGGISHPGGYLIDDVSVAAPPPVAFTAAGADNGPADATVVVTAFGARGDGETDNTAAFQAALNACHLRGGGVVQVPTGRFRFAGNLLIPSSVTLRGVWQAPPIPERFKPPGTPAKLAGSVLLAEAGAGDADGIPFIRLDANSGVRGLTITYPNQTPTNPPVAYPWTVATLGADNCSLVDIMILNPYQAVDFGSHASGRHYIRGLYADPLYRGLYIDQCLDVGRVENVHFWPFYDTDLKGPLRAFVLENCEAFVIGRTDWEYMTNCFAYGQKTGFHFIRGNGRGPHSGPGNVLMTQSGSDMADAAIMVDELQGHSGVLASNCQFFGDIVVHSRNVGPMRFSNCGFYGSLHGGRGVSQALLEGQGSVSFQNCHFIALHPANQAPVAILARTGTLSLVGCEFMTPGRQQVVLEKAVRRAVLTGNQFAGRMRVVNHASGRIEMGLNVDDTPQMPEGTLLVDDTDVGAGFTVAGAWTPTREAGHFMGTCRWSAPVGPATAAEWRPVVPTAGRYAVEVWYGPDANDDHATDARFTVHHAEGAASVTVDLKTDVSQWRRLGVFTLPAGTDAHVVLEAVGDGNVLADAVRFVPVRGAGNQ